MSSPKSAAAKTAAAKPAPRAAKRAKPPARAASQPGAPPAAGLAADAQRLAAALEQALAQGKLDALPPDALQALMGALCRTYSAQVEAGQTHLPLRALANVNSTDIMSTASGLLKAANLAVFELGMWQSWTGR